MLAPPVVLVMLQPDLGTSLVFVAILVGALFLSGASLRWMGLAAGLVVAALPIIWSILHDYQRRRLLTFLDPTSDPQGAGYQVNQSLIAIGSGGLFGKGLTNGSQAAADFLPVQSTDFAFAVLLEELGFIGGLVVFLLFIGLIWRILVIGWRSDSVFGIAFAGGVAAMVVFQMLVNAGMVSGMMPVTGIPLPFITHGGASLISTAIGLGILQSIHMRRVAAVLVALCPARSKQQADLGPILPAGRRAHQPFEELGIVAPDLAQRPTAVPAEVDDAALGRAIGRTGGTDGNVALVTDQPVAAPSIAPTGQPLVVLVPPVRVTQRVVGVVDGRHHARRFRARVEVRVAALGKLAVDRADDLLIGDLGDHQRPVQRLARVSHHATRSLRGP